MHNCCRQYLRNCICNFNDQVWGLGVSLCGHCIWEGGGGAWMRQARSNFQFFHDYHDHRQGAKACPRHDNKVLTYTHIWYFYSSSRLVPLLLSDEVWSQAGGERASGATGHFSGAAIFFRFWFFFSLVSTIFLTSKSKSRRTKIQNNNQMSFDSPSPSIRSIRSIRIQHRMSVLQVFIPFATFAHHHHTCHLQITLITDPLPEERPSSSSNFRAWPTNMMKMWKMNFERCWINWEQSHMTRLKSIQHTAKKVPKSYHTNLEIEPFMCQSQFQRPTQPEKRFTFNNLFDSFSLSILLAIHNEEK